MCFLSQQIKSALELENRHNAKFEPNSEYVPSAYNGFEHPKTPVIANCNVNSINMFQWGLIPSWATDKSIQKYTLNAKIETIHEKPSFKSSLNKRCLVLCDAFYEWQWLDSKGKRKQKYKIYLPNNESFAFAGLWNEWTDKNTGEIIKSYTILTTEANELMSKIHNSKKRMPIVLRNGKESDWLVENKIIDNNYNLIAEKLI